MKDIHDLFQLEDTSSFHDSVLEATNISLSDDKLKKLFKALPVGVQGTAYTYGLSDTVFNDQVLNHVRTVGLDKLI